MLKMLLIVVFIGLLQSVITNSDEKACGCGISRTQTEQIKANNLGLKTDSRDHCPVEFENNELNIDKIGHDARNNMVLVPGGEYQLGTNDIIIENDMEGPMKIVQLNSFYLDKYEVSNKDFNDFTILSNYKTEAEVFGDSFVFGIFLNNTFKEELKDFRVVQATWWYKVLGAYWRHPYGPDSDISDLMEHPVVHISWRDAKAFCEWRGARLPTEAEWEAACRGGHRDTKYPWGDKLFPGRKYMANIWQGTFPNHNSAKDGYIGTNPINLFAQNDFGLFNMAGNVWEWTEDSWSKDNPKEKVKKGGSYLCHQSYCYRYRCSARSHNTEDSSAGNLGFRCAKTP